MTDSELLKAYRDTGLEPEDVRRLQKDWTSLIITIDEMGCMPHLRELYEAEKEGRLVVLDEPMRPLVWGDKEHDTILCPRCLCDLMGGLWGLTLMRSAGTSAEKQSQP